MSPVALVFVLLLAATVLAGLARRLGIPYPILLVLGGLILGVLPGVPAVQLEPDVVFLLFLPPILFGAGYFTSIRDFKANLRPILLLSVGLVLFTMTAVAIVVYGWSPSSAGRWRSRRARSWRRRMPWRRPRCSSGSAFRGGW